MSDWKRISNRQTMWFPLFFPTMSSVILVVRKKNFLQTTLWFNANSSNISGQPRPRGVRRRWSIERASVKTQTTENVTENVSSLSRGLMSVSLLSFEAFSRYSPFHLGTREKNLYDISPFFNYFCGFVIEKNKNCQAKPCSWHIAGARRNVLKLYRYSRRIDPESGHRSRWEPHEAQISTVWAGTRRREAMEYVL